MSVFFPNRMVTVPTVVVDDAQGTINTVTDDIGAAKTATLLAQSTRGFIVQDTSGGAISFFRGQFTAVAAF